MPAVASCFFLFSLRVGGGGSRLRYLHHLRFSTHATHPQKEESSQTHGISCARGMQSDSVRFNAHITSTACSTSILLVPHAVTVRAYY